MKKLVGLNDNYISVDGSFGGSQTFFRGVPGFWNKYRDKGGCGIVALTDIVNYLSSTNTFSSKDEYMKEFKKNSLRIAWIPTKYGLSFIQQTIGLKILLSKSHQDYKCFWCLSKKKLLPRISRMLSKNIPVPICIPNTLFKRNNIDTLPFYNEDRIIISRVKGHFVVATGIFEDEKSHEVYLQISSWGQKYYISYNEYMKYLKTHFWGIVGGMLFIYKD